MGIKVFNSLDVAGIETSAADPVANLFLGRVYYNTTAAEARMYNGSAWVALGGFQSDIYFNKFVGSAPGYYATLSAALAAAAPGDRILVVNNVTEVSDINVSTQKLRITFQPGVEITFNGASHSSPFTISAYQVLVEGGWLNYQGSTNIASMLYLINPAADIRVRGMMLNMNSAAKVCNNAVDVGGSVVRSFVDVAVREGAGTVTSNESNGSNSTRVEIVR